MEVQSSENGTAVNEMIDRAKKAIMGNKQPGQTVKEFSANDFSGVGKKASSIWSTKVDEAHEEEIEDEEPDPEEEKRKKKRIDRVTNSPTLFRAGAQSTTIGIDSVKTLLYGFLEQKRFKKQCNGIFTEEQSDKLDKYESVTDMPAPTNEDKIIFNKWDRIYERHRKKMGDISMKQKDKENMEALFFALQEYNGKPISPVVSIYIQIIKEMVHGGMVVYMED